MAFCLNLDVIGECLIGQKIAKTKQRHKIHAHKRSAMVNGVVAGAGSLKHASGHTGPRRVGGIRRRPPPCYARRAANTVIEITGLAFAFKAAGETQRRVERGLICYSADEFPLPVFRQMSSMFDQIEREWFGPGKI
jgi:hypothetical protein